LVTAARQLLDQMGLSLADLHDTGGTRQPRRPSPNTCPSCASTIRTRGRRNYRGGRSAVEHLTSALRCLYKRTVADGIIAEADWLHESGGTQEAVRSCGSATKLCALRRFWPAPDSPAVKAGSPTRR